MQIVFLKDLAGYCRILQIYRAISGCANSSANLREELSPPPLPPPCLNLLNIYIYRRGSFNLSTLNRTSFESFFVSRLRSNYHFIPASNIPSEGEPYIMRTSRGRIRMAGILGYQVVPSHPIERVIISSRITGSPSGTRVV